MHSDQGSPKTVKGRPTVVVFFYIPWAEWMCNPICQNVEPTECLLIVDIVSEEIALQCSMFFSMGLSQHYVTVVRPVATVEGREVEGEWPSDQRGTGVINYLHCRPCHRENLGARANLGLPSLLAHRGVRSGRSNLGDPVGGKQMCTRTVKDCRNAFCVL